MASVDWSHTYNTDTHIKKTELYIKIIHSNNFICTGETGEAGLNSAGKISETQTTVKLLSSAELSMNPVDVFTVPLIKLVKYE